MMTAYPICGIWHKVAKIYTTDAATLCLRRRILFNFHLMECLMKKRILLHSRTALVALLVTNFIQPLHAVREAKTSVSQNRKASTSLTGSVIKKLENDGLDHQAAIEKTSEMLKGDPQFATLKLDLLLSHEKLGLSDESVIEAMSRRALFGKALDLDSYDSLTGFIQDIKGRPLNDLERAVVREIAALEQAA
jgi:hypothetical protein